MEQNQISSSVEGRNQGTTTGDLLRMPVFSGLVSGGGGTVSEKWEREREREEGRESKGERNLGRERDY